MGMSFMYGMGSFTQNNTAEISFTESLLWIWNPIAMAAWDPQKASHGSRNPQLVGRALICPTIFAVIIGFGFPWVQRRKLRIQT